MRPLTELFPKPLLPLANKPLLEHILGKMPPAVDEFIFVVGYLGTKIQKHCGEKFLGRPVTYVWQTEKRGTWDALLRAEPYIHPGERFFVVYGDDLHGAEGLAECLRYPRAILVDNVEDARPYGVVVTDSGGLVSDIIEKPADPPSSLVSTGVLLLDRAIFQYSAEPHPVSGEVFLTEPLRKMARDYPVKAVHSTFWFPVTTPDDLAEAEKLMRMTSEFTLPKKVF